MSLYDLLLELAPSPVVRLSRAIAVGQAEGAARGLEELRAIEGVGALARYPFYEAALGTFTAASGRADSALSHFEAALALARNPIERRFFARHLADLDRSSKNAGLRKSAGSFEEIGCVRFETVNLAVRHYSHALSLSADSRVRAAVSSRQVNDACP